MVLSWFCLEIAASFGGVRKMGSQIRAQILNHWIVHEFLCPRFSVHTALIKHQGQLQTVKPYLEHFNWLVWSETPAWKHMLPYLSLFLLHQFSLSTLNTNTNMFASHSDCLGRVRWPLLVSASGCFFGDMTMCITLQYCFHPFSTES